MTNGWSRTHGVQHAIGACGSVQPPKICEGARRTPTSTSCARPTHNKYGLLRHLLDTVVRHTGNTTAMCTWLFAIALVAPNTFAHPLEQQSRLHLPYQPLISMEGKPKGVGYQYANGQLPLQARPSYLNVTNPTQRAALALDALQSWYNPNTGLWETTGWWNGANIMTVVGDFANADPENNTLQTLARNVFATTLVKAPGKNPNPGVEDRRAQGKPGVASWGRWGQGRWRAWGGEYKKYLDPNTGEPHTSYPTNWYTISMAPAAAIDSSAPNASDWLDGYYDDDLWWALAWINAYDVTFNTPYLKLAEDIFLAVARTWGTYCFGGGIYWSHEKNYVNAIANELFFSTAAHLATRVEFQKQVVYREWAEKSLKWFLQTGMLNQKGTINDGLTKDCKNNGQTTWSYNQGVILGGLVELQKASPSPKNQFIALASHIANAALIELSDRKGVIHDECEPNCGADGTQFKGIFMRNLVKLQGAGKEDFRKAINANANSIWENDRSALDNGLNVFSVDWAGPFIQPANASTQSSAMEALIGAVVVPCRDC